MMAERGLLCVVCGRDFHAFPPCTNGCCLGCHAMYCHPRGHTIDLKEARARYSVVASCRREESRPLLSDCWFG